MRHPLKWGMYVSLIAHFRVMLDCHCIVSRAQREGIAHVDCSFCHLLMPKFKDQDPKTGRERITRRVLIGEMFKQDTFTKTIIVRYQIVKKLQGDHDYPMYELKVDFADLNRKVRSVCVCMSREQFDNPELAFPFVGLCHVGKSEWVPFYFDYLDDLRDTEIPWFMEGAVSSVMAGYMAPPMPERPKLGGA